MDYQSIYDDLDNLIRNIDNAIEEIEDKKYMKDYIDSLNYIKYDLENNKEEISEKLEEEQKREEMQQEYLYERSVIQMEDNKYSEIIKGLTFEQLVYERALLKKQETNLYIQKKELDDEFKRRLENRDGRS